MVSSLAQTAHWLQYVLECYHTHHYLNHVCCGLTVEMSQAYNLSQFMTRSPAASYSPICANALATSHQPIVNLQPSPASIWLSFTARQATDHSQHDSHRISGLQPIPVSHTCIPNRPNPTRLLLLLACRRHLLVDCFEALLQGRV